MASLPWFQGSAYDDVYIAAECLKQTNDDQDADGFRDCLYSLTRSGAIGDNYSFDENGDVVGTVQRRCRGTSHRRADRGESGLPRAGTRSYSVVLSTRWTARGPGRGTAVGCSVSRPPDLTKSRTFVMRFSLEL